jgi:hypothetical protein
MTNSLESSDSSKPQTTITRSAGWVKLGAIAGASALAGGLAAAWWYRNTLKRLYQAEDRSANPHFGIHLENLDDES